MFTLNKTIKLSILREQHLNIAYNTMNEMVMHVQTFQQTLN